MKYFNPEIHHRTSYRLKNWDYSSSAYYFVSICIRNRQLYYFGNIYNDKIILNDIGKIINQCWTKIPEHFNNVILDEYVIMPNHVHGIMRIINNYRKNITKQYQYIHTVGTCHNVGCRDVACNVPTKQNIINIKMSQISPTTNSLSTIIRSFKSTCTKILKQNNQIYISFIHLDD